MEQNIKVKLHWGSPSLSLTTGLKTKCTQSEHMTLNATRRHLSLTSPLPLSWNALCFYSVWTTRGWVNAVNLTFDLISVSCAHVWMWLWTVLCFWHTHFWIYYDKQFKPLVAVCVWGGGCHCSGATPPSNGQITALHMWDSNAPTSGLNHLKSTRSAISAVINKVLKGFAVFCLRFSYVPDCFICSYTFRQATLYTMSHSLWVSLLMWRCI